MTALAPTLGMTGRWLLRAVLLVAAASGLWALAATHAPAARADQTAFISAWDTTNTSGGSSANNQIALPLIPQGNYNFTVNWGDGQKDTITQWDVGTTHTYVEPGMQTITITGTFEGFAFQNDGDRNKLIDVLHWGIMRLGNVGRYFEGAENFTGESATDAPLLTGGVHPTTDLSLAFSGATNFNGHIGNWDTSQVTNMTLMFQDATSFNQDIGSWNTINVGSMAGMFDGATSFDQNIGGWQMGNVQDTSTMFWGASAFDNGGSPTIDDWSTSGVTSMALMFQDATSFNQPIGNWDVSHVTSMESMFQGASKFNQPIGSWTTSALSSAELMFAGAARFNQPIGSWDTDQVPSFNSMFSGATAFDQNVGTWSIDSLADAGAMFAGVTLSPTIYGQILQGWSVPSGIVTGIEFGAGSSRYWPDDADFRQALIDNGWNVTDDGAVPAFTSTWDTRNAGPGSSGSDQIHLPLIAGGTYDFYVDWGDSSPEDHITAWDQSEATHTFTDPGRQYLSITGTINGWSFNGSGDLEKLLDITQWGVLQLGPGGNNFSHARFFNPTATDAPDLTGTISLNNAFSYTDTFDAPIGNWKTGTITDLQGTFAGTSVFDQNLNAWDTSHVSNMNSTFTKAYAFNGNVTGWETGSATNMDLMFGCARVFNRDIGGWDTHQVGSMIGMFMAADDGACEDGHGDGSAFDRDLSSWDTGAVTTMSGMFWGADHFNSELGDWDTGVLEDVSNMFRMATSFDKDLSTWNTQAINAAADMFTGMALSSRNYSRLLTGWAAQPDHAENVTFGGGNSQYRFWARSARDDGLAGLYTWTITDGGLSTDGTVSATVYGSPNSTGASITGGVRLGDDPSRMAPYTGLTALNAAPVYIRPVCFGGGASAVEATEVTPGHYSADLSTSCSGSTTDLRSYQVSVSVGGGSCLVAAGLPAGNYVTANTQVTIPGYDTALPDDSGAQAYLAAIGSLPRQFYAETAGVYLPAARACATPAPTMGGTSTTDGRIGAVTQAPPSNGGSSDFRLNDSIGITGFNRVLAKPNGDSGTPYGGYRSTYARCAQVDYPTSGTAAGCQLGGAGGIPVTGGDNGVWNPAACDGQTIDFRQRSMTMMGFGLWSASPASVVMADPCT